MEKYGYIYITTNLLNGKKYVGQHAYSVFDENYKGSGIYLTKAIKKEGKENFKVALIEWCDSQEKLDEREVYWIDYYSAVESDNFYNLAKGGDGCKKGSKLSEETKKRISESHQGEKHNMYGKHHSEKTKLKMSMTRKGRKFTKEHKRNMSKHHADNRGENSPWYGKHHSNETKKKISEANQGRVFSEEHKQKISENHANISGKNNPMYGVRLTKEKNPMYGKHHSEETKKKISQVLSDGRKAGENHPLYGKKWINDGNKNKLIMPDEMEYYLSIGYKKGTIIRKRGSV